jgi:PAS domain S-box-containing protein
MPSLSIPGFVLVIALWSALGCAIAWDRKTEVTAARDEAATLANALAAHSERILREAEQIASFVAWEAQNKGVRLPLRQYVQAGVLTLDGFLQVAVIDRTGILRSSTVDGFKEIDLSDRQHFKVHLTNSSDRLFVAPPLVGRASAKTSIQLSRRITGSDGRFMGVVVVSMDPAALTGLFDQLRIGSQGLVLVFGTDDFVIRARRSGNKEISGATLLADSLFRKALKENSVGSFEAVMPIDGIKRTVSYRLVPDYPLAVAVGFSQADYLAAFTSRRNLLVAAGLLLTVLLCFVDYKKAKLFARLNASLDEARSARERYRLLVDLSPNAVLVYCEDRLSFANPAGVRMLGANSPDELLGKAALDCIHEKSRDIVKARMRKLHEDGAMAPPLEETWLRVDGSDFQGEASAVPYEENGRPAVLVLLQDVTARSRAEAERDRFFDLSLDLLCIGSADGYFKNANPAFRKTLGWSEEEFLSQPFLSFVHPDDRAATQVEISKLTSGTSTENFANRYICKDGSSRWLAWNAVTTSDGLMYAAARDVTEARAANELLEQAKAEAEAASRAKSAFLATMSHEIRTPMNGVIGMIEVLSRTPLSRDQLDMTRTIRESAGALLSIIDDILDFSKIEAGRLELEREPVALADMVEGLCGSLVPVAARKKVQLNTFISPALPQRVLSDDTRLRQLLYNLVGNAIKFSGGRPEHSGRVSVSVELVEAVPLKVAFSVTDNGIGMTAETIASLFVPFNQAEVSTTRRFGGTGLGLAICRRLAALMQGEISVSSEPGRGSTFIVQIPFETVSPEPIASSHDLSGIEYVLINTQTFEAEYLRAYLEHAGASVSVAFAGAPPLKASMVSSAPIVVIHDGSWPAGVVTALNRGVDNGAVRQLVILSGQRGMPRIESPDRVVLGGDGLRRQTLLHGAAVAAGRASPRSWPEESSEISASAHAMPPAIAEARAQGRLILVAEDDEINQKVILRQLGLLGYAAEVASDGKEALRLWRENHYTLLLTDLHMPQMDGYELSTSIRSAEVGRPRMPIVALTANALQGEASRAKAAGMDAYLTKPLRLDALKAALDQWLVPRDATEAAPQAADKAPDTPPRSAVDLSVLTALIGDDNEVMCELLSDYLASVRRLSGELRSHSLNGEARHVGAIAHKLKSSSRSVGALALGDLCNELENAGRAEDRAGIAHWMARFEEALPAIECEIATFLDGE